MKDKRSTKIKRVVKTRAEVERDQVLAKAVEIGIPVNQIVHGNFAQVDVPRLDKGVRVKTTKTLINNGGTPIARWKAAKLLTDRQVLAIEHCEAMWVALNGRSVVMNYGGVGGGSLSANTGMREQEALDNLKRIKGYFPSKWWALFESVCRFDEPAGFAGSRLTECKNEQVAAARTTVQVVADIIAMNERL